MQNILNTSDLPLCHCGKPLHFKDDKQKKHSINYIRMTGEYAKMQSFKTGKYYKVQRYYIILHGIKLYELDDLGFEEIIDNQENKKPA